MTSTDERSYFWYLKMFALFIWIPIRICGLYYADVLSDILQMFGLYNNCHIEMFFVSFSIVVSSYFTTVFYIKYSENLPWSKAFFYPWIFE